MEGFFSKKETESVSHPSGKIRTCISCGAFKTAKTPKMAPYGNFKKGIMNIGPFPGESDDLRGRPFQGSYGKLVKDAYQAMGIDLFEDCVNLNAVNCCPTTKSGEIREPSGIEVETCRRSIIAYIKKYKPRVIVIFGDIPITSVIGHRWKSDLGGIEKWRGWCIPDREYNAWVIPVYSPEFIHQREKKAEVWTIWRQDLLNVKEKLKEPLPVYKEPVIEIVEDWSCLDTIQDGIAAFDYETTGLKPHLKAHKIVCLSVADGPNHVWVGMMPEGKNGRRPIRDLLTRRTVRKMAHNMKFEDSWTNEKLKVQVSPWWWDSMLAAHVLDNRENVTGLKFQTYVQFGVGDYASEVSPYLKAKDDKNANAMNRIWELVEKPGGREKLLTYCGYDSIYEYRLALLQQSIIKPPSFVL